MNTSNPPNEIILYQPDNALKLEVRLENETVWLNRQQMAQLFDRDIKTIGKHIGNALAEELSGFPTVANFATVQTEGFENSVYAKFATTAADGKIFQAEYCIRRIFTEGELEEKVVCKDFLHITQHGAMKGATKTVSWMNFQHVPFWN